MQYFKDKFEEGGFYFIPLPFRGEYQGICYPAGYTEEEKRIFKDFIDNLNISDNTFKNDVKEWIDNQVVYKKSKGKLCRAGQIYAHLDINGTVHRCSASISKNMPIGNFFDDNFRLLNMPLPCDMEFCHCEAKWLVEEDESFNRRKEDLCNITKINE